MTKVFVVMGNDYPESVWASETLANEFVFAKNMEEKKAEEERSRTTRNLGRGRIYWRVYEFELKQTKEDVA